MRLGWRYSCLCWWIHRTLGSKQNRGPQPPSPANEILWHRPGSPLRGFCAFLGWRSPPLRARILWHSRPRLCSIHFLIESSEDDSLRADISPAPEARKEVSPPWSRAPGSPTRAVFRVLGWSYAKAEGWVSVKKDVSPSGAAQHNLSVVEEKHWIRNNVADGLEKRCSLPGLQHIDCKFRKPMM